MADTKENDPSNRNSKNTPFKENPPSGNRAVYKSSSEYCSAVNKWLWQYYYAQCFAASLPYMLSNSFGNRTDPNLVNLQSNRNNTDPVEPQNITNDRLNLNQRAVVGRVYYLPPLWKRFLAELIDFFILVVLKLIVTYVAVDVFKIVNVDKYDLDILKEEKMDYKAALDMASEILFMEFILRFLVCIFEAVCLHRGFISPGGATPGKSFLRLRVVKCYAVETLPDTNQAIRVYPAENLGFGRALLRALIKNLSMAFFQPVCISLFFFQHNRAAYDIICKSIVVEDPLPVLRRPAN